MAKRTDIDTVLIIGAGPIVIGQACEFDYSGAQACKALREEGYRVILVNSNPATIMTDPGMADATYIEPITWQMVEKIIEKERPDALLPTMGGQTALNCALDLHKYGVLAKYGVEMIGANEHAIEKAEDRLKFKEAMTKIGLGSARSAMAHTLDEALAAQKAVGFPAVIRPSFTLGGTGGGIAYIRAERSGRGNGRVYRVEYQATDAHGGRCLGTVTVNVPLSIGQPTANGDLDKAIIRRYVKRNISKITYCYEKELVRTPGLFGKIDMEWTITADGLVREAKPKASTMNNPEVERCIAEKIRTWEFPKPKGGGIVVVRYPFVFKTAG